MFLKKQKKISLSKSEKLFLDSLVPLENLFQIHPGPQHSPFSGDELSTLRLNHVITKFVFAHDKSLQPISGFECSFGISPILHLNPTRSFFLHFVQVLAHPRRIQGWFYVLKLSFLYLPALLVPLPP